ncbi:hypothetical protein TUBRATIS_10290 [Tubulinosema ratisbonensis]|uniref:Uncharacterized protein n=1 Tax=Tubulinosema ratisbonensis TaxID=291195 RepID=A0A437AMQ4_9MICR|nr:hypothetical protein TUBRATIS_10290 [Tubulinosema ratisbonensis]
MLLTLLTFTQAQLFNARVHRSIWITTPNGLQYHSAMMPKVIRPTVFVTQNDNSDMNDNLNTEPESRPDNDSSRGKYEKIKGGLYEAIFGGGIWRIVIYIVVAVAFLIIGYQIRKQEEYGNYVRLPNADN